MSAEINTATNAAIAELHPPDYSLLGDVELGWARSSAAAVPRKSAVRPAR